MSATGGATSPTTVTTEPAPRLGPGTDVETPCKHWTGDRHCGVTPTNVYLTGARCIDHTPSALAGRPESVPDPERTITGLRARRSEPSDVIITVGGVRV